MTLNSVDLPQPDGPITPRNSPGATVSDRLSTAVRIPSGVSNCLVTPSTTSTASALPGAAALPLLGFNWVAAGIRKLLAIDLLGFPRHRRGHGGCVARFHPHVDNRNMSLLDGRD